MTQKQEFEGLDALLEKRHYEPAFPALAERIINAAKYPGRPFNVMEWLKDLFADFRLQPAYAVTMMLLIGVSIGASEMGLAVPEDNANLTLEASISDEGNFL